MRTVLHLLDPWRCGDEGVLLCAAAASVAPWRHEVWVIGGAADERRAWALGVASAVRVQARAGPLGAMARSLRRLARAAFPSAEGPDVVQCYSAPGLGLARAAFGHRRPARVGVVPHPPRTARAAARAAPDLEWAVACVLEDRARAYLAPEGAAARGRSRQRDDLRLIEPPCFPPGGPAGPGRAEVRARLGIDPADTVVGLLADPPGAGDAQRLAFSLGLAKALGHRAVGLVRRGASQERRAARFVRSQMRRWDLVLADLALTELVAASDALVLDAAGPPGAERATAGPVAVALAASAGVPVACAAGAEPAGWAAPGPPVFPAPSPTLGRVAAPIVDWLERPALRVEHAARLRSWCEAARARDGFRRTLEAVWAEAANLPRAVPGLPRPVLLGGAA